MKEGRLPERFIERLAIIAPNATQAVLKTFHARPTTFRVNTIKGDRHTIITQIKEAGFKIREIPWSPLAFILANRSKRELMEHPTYAKGEIYLQSLASQVPSIVLNPKPGDRILDLTAAPGSKSSQIAALMQRQGEIVVNDSNRVRFFKLKHLMDHLGVYNPHDDFLKIRLEDGGKLCHEYPEYFDRILLDAPCSAEARFQIDDIRTMGYWNEHKVKEMAQKQRRLLLGAWHALKVGGTLVYSTCTFAPEENELQISKFLKKIESGVRVEPVELSSLKKLPILTSWKEKPLNSQVTKCLRIHPTDEIEGFFIAKFTKTASQPLQQPDS